MSYEFLSIIAGFIIIAAILLLPGMIFIALGDLRRKTKNEAREQFEIASQLQNSINSMMASFVMAMTRDALGKGQRPNSVNQVQEGFGEDFESWNLYETEIQQPQLSNTVKKTKDGKNGFLIGFLSGLSIFLFLALITVLKVR